MLLEAAVSIYDPTHSFKSLWKGAIDCGYGDEVLDDELVPDDIASAKVWPVTNMLHSQLYTSAGGSAIWLCSSPHDSWNVQGDR